MFTISRMQRINASAESELLSLHSNTIIVRRSIFRPIKSDRCYCTRRKRDKYLTTSKAVA